MDKLTNEQINLKTNTILLIDYLEALIGDEMILNSFIRDLEIVEENAKRIIITISTRQGIEIIESTYKEVFDQGVESIYNKPLGVKLILRGDEKFILNGEKSRVIESKNVSKKFTFDNYVVADFNKEASMIGKKIVINPGKFSPVYIHSKSGLGKTHLLHAIGNSFVESDLSACYIEPNKFTRTITALSKEGGSSVSDYIQEFEKYDVLLFDDIQNLGDRSVTLKVLFNIINQHLDQDKQIVIASDKVSHELSGFQARFITRFDSGISTKIKEPEIDDLIKVLEAKIDEEELNSSKWEMDALKFIARNNSTSIRSLEGAVKRIVFFTDNESNIKYTYEVISNIFKELAIDPAELTPSRIITTVASYYKIHKKDIVGKSRKQEFVVARRMAIFLIRKINKLSFSEIGKHIGNRDHSTIISAVTKIEHNMKINNAVKIAANKIEAKIKSIN